MTKSVSGSEIEWIRLLRWILWLSAMPALLVGSFMGHGLPPRWFWIVLFAYSSLNLILLWFRGESQRNGSLKEISHPAANAYRGDGGAQ